MTIDERVIMFLDMKGLSPSGTTGTATVYDDRIQDRPTGGLSVPYGVETSIYLMMLQLSTDLYKLTEEVRSLKEELSNRPLVSSLLLNELGDDRFEIATPISIILEEADEECLARWPEVNAFGIGSTIGEAISNLKENILELYSDITSRDRENLGEFAVGTLAALETYIRAKK